MEPFKIKDEVVYHEYGEGTVIDVNPRSPYPVMVYFDETHKTKIFTKEGKPSADFTGPPDLMLRHSKELYGTGHGHHN